VLIGAAGGVVCDFMLIFAGLCQSSAALRFVLLVFQFCSVLEGLGAV